MTTDPAILRHSLLICALADHLRVKRLRPDVLCFVRLGDFYETFGEDAATAAGALSIVLTSMRNGREQVPMSGVPVHAAENYFARLLARGHKLAVLEPDAPPRLLSPISPDSDAPPAEVKAKLSPALPAMPAALVGTAVQLSLFG